MSFVSIQFLWVLVITKLLSSLPVPPILRRWALLCMSVYFAQCFLLYYQFRALLVFCAFSYGLAFLGSRFTAISRRVYLPVVACVFFYLLLKGYFGNPFREAWFAQVLGLAGISYIFFRLISLIQEVCAKRISLPTPDRFFLYLFYFPSFLSGPVQGYGDFSSELLRWEKEGGRNAPVTGPFFRAALGLFKLCYASVILDKLAKFIAFQDLLSIPPYQVVAILVLCCVCYTLQFYVNFSGYIDLMVSVSRWLGISIPENFNEPLRARNFTDLWQRWHITVSNWFRDFVFSPLLKFSISTFARRKRQWHRWIAVGCAVISFVLMGLWHGTGVYFLKYGLMLGLGVAVSQLWAFYAPKTWPHENPAWIFLGRVLTFTFFSVALVMIHPEFYAVKNTFQALPVGFRLATLFALMAGWGLILFQYDWGAVLWRRLRAAWDESGQLGDVLIPLGASLVFYFLVVYGVYTHGAFVRLAYQTY